MNTNMNYSRQPGRKKVSEGAYSFASASMPETAPERLSDGMGSPYQWSMM
jgi:hypothetical protein